MKVFVTGGTGYLGSHIVVALLRAGNRVTVMSRNPGAASVLAENGAQVVLGDLQDQSTMEALLKGHQALIHNAVLWEDEDGETGARDVEASSNLFQAAARAGIEHGIYTSSTAVHRPFKTVMSEADELAPADDYARTKAQGEAALREVSKVAGLKATVLRPGPVVGSPAFPGRRVHPDRRFLIMASLARSGAEVVVRKGEGRQFIGARDLARVYVRLVERAVSGTFIVVAKEVITWEWIAKEMVATFGSSSRVVVEESELAVVPKFDVGKLDRGLGFSFEAVGAVSELIRYLALTRESP